MRKDLLNVLECAYCGGDLRPEQNAALEESRDEIQHGILLCDCCAYPIVSGIPYLRTGGAANRAMQLLGKGKRLNALAALLGLPEAAGVALMKLHSPTATFEESMLLLNRSAEAQYLLYRFSDPTFIASEAVVTALGGAISSGCILDLCGGTGHLTRCLAAVAQRDVVLADLEFWKLYLAARFVVPTADIVCCNANEPLPFRSRQFSFVLCADAFHYIWSKRQLAAEMHRVSQEEAPIVLPHVHNSLCWNPSQGTPLPPSAYVRLFPNRHLRVFPESMFLQAGLTQGAVDLSIVPSASEIDGSPALLVVAAGSAAPFRMYPPAARDTDNLYLNPLYHQNPSDPTHWRRVFPSSDYEDEYEGCASYLPPSVKLAVDHSRRPAPPLDAEQIRTLANHRVLLDLPEHYCGSI